MKRVMVFNNRKKMTITVKHQLMNLLRQKGFVLTKQNPDVIVVIGGDGTMLSAIRSLHHLNVPFLGVNTGSLGFLPGLFPEEFEKVPELLASKELYSEKYPLMDVKIKDTHGAEISGEFFNEVLIRHEQPRLMEAHMYLNDQPFNYFTGDGFIISTPIGATGYSIWAGGAVIHPELQAIEITPLHPNDNRINRPLKHSMIIPQNTKIKIKIVMASQREVMVANDGIAMEPRNIEEIRIEDSLKVVSILKAREEDYFMLFRNKIIDKHIFRYLENENEEQ